MQRIFFFKQLKTETNMKKTPKNQAKKVLYIVTFFLLISLNAKSQTYTLPKGYQTYKDYEGKEVRGDGDFDGDGLNDLAILCSNEGNTIVVVYLASKWMLNESYWWFPWESESVYIVFENNVLIVNTTDCLGRCYTNLKFKYYSSNNNMKLIGYEDGNFGDADHNGAYNKNINLNTGEYEVDGVRRKISLDLITLSNVEKYFDYLKSVGSNYINE